MLKSLNPGLVIGVCAITASRKPRLYGNTVLRKGLIHSNGYTQ